MKQLSLELINYQNNDPVVDKLIVLIESIYKEIDNNVYKTNSELLNKSSYIKELKDTLVDRFNLNIEIDPVFHALTPMAIFPFFGDYLQEYKKLLKFGPDFFVKLLKGNIPLSVLEKRYRYIIREKERLFKDIHKKKGYIDFKRARVGGYLADVKHYLIMDLFTMKNLGLDPVELVSTLLHEVGHAFTGLEYHFKLERTNVVILDILDNINKNNLEKAEYIFRKEFSEDEFKNLSLDNKLSRYDFYGHLALKYLEVIKTQMVNNKYDETTFEVLADSFSSRFGMYKPLVSGLNKIYSKYGLIYTYQTTPTFLETYGSLIFILVLAFIPPIGTFIFLFVLISLFTTDGGKMVYDFPVERMERIGNQLVNNIKNNNLPKEIEKDLIEQFVFINSIVQKSNNFKGALDKLSDFLSLTKKDNNHYIKLQRTIENNLNNILFVKSKQLKHS